MTPLTRAGEALLRSDFDTTGWGPSVVRKHVTEAVAAIEAEAYEQGRRDERERLRHDIGFVRDHYPDSVFDTLWLELTAILNDSVTAEAADREAAVRPASGRHQGLEATGSHPEPARTSSEALAPSAAADPDDGGES